MSPLSVLLAAVAAFVVWSAISLCRNYTRCRRIGFPIVVSPTATLDPLWSLLYNVCPWILPLLRSLPFSLGLWARFTYMGWQYDDKHAVHHDLGPVFVLCTPGVCEVHVADPAAAWHVLTHRKEYDKPPLMYDVLNAFGRNVDSVKGDEWQKHRKLTAPSFNERVSKTVWAESIRQAVQVLAHWTSRGDRGTTDTAEDMAMLTLNIFSNAGFGVQHDFKSAAVQVSPPFTMSHRDALYTVVTNFIPYIVILPLHALNWRIWPGNMRKVGEACTQLQMHLKDMVERERQLPLDCKARHNNNNSNNLLSALVQSSQTQGQGLGDEELYGNLFIYSLAGHETSASALANSIVHMAAEPKWQDWVTEELDAVFSASEPPEAWDYDQAFPRLKRCHAVMFETLRLNGPAPVIPKAAEGDSQTLVVDGRSHVIPGGTFVITNSQGLHTDPKVWGGDALRWNPSRWIAKGDGPGKEELFEPEQGSFVAWSEGPRVCPGRRFSQVELVATIAVLFARSTVSPRRLTGESALEARRRAKHMVDDCGITTGITLKMRDPTVVSMVWKPRV